MAKKTYWHEYRCPTCGEGIGNEERSEAAVVVGKKDGLPCDSDGVFVDGDDTWSYAADDCVDCEEAIEDDQDW